MLQHLHAPDTVSLPHGLFLHLPLHLPPEEAPHSLKTSARCVFTEGVSLGRLVFSEPLQVVAQHSFGFKGLAAAAGMGPLAGVVQLVDPQQRAGEEELSAGDAVVALLSSVFGSLVAQQRA